MTRLLIAHSCLDFVHDRRCALSSRGCPVRSFNGAICHGAAAAIQTGVDLLVFAQSTDPEQTNGFAEKTFTLPTQR